MGVSVRRVKRESPSERTLSLAGRHGKAPPAVLEKTIELLEAGRAPTLADMRIEES